MIKMKIEAMFGVTFDLFSKIEVNTNDAIPLYQWLKSSEVGDNKDIAWNFESFVINRCGQVHSRHLSDEQPETWEDEIQGLINGTISCSSFQM